MQEINLSLDGKNSNCHCLLICEPNEEHTCMYFQDGTAGCKFRFSENVCLNSRANYKALLESLESIYETIDTHIDNKRKVLYGINT